MEKVYADWGKIEYDYVVNGINQRDLAKKYGVSQRTITDHSKKGKWVEKRRNHQREISSKLRQKSRDDLLKNVDKALRILGKDLDRLEELGDKADSLLFTTQSPGREMESKVNATIKIVEQLRKIAGLMDPKDEAKIMLEREKFEFEKKKADREEDRNSEITVVLEGDIDKWAE